jgi:hypothetical protein
MNVHDLPRAAGHKALVEQAYRSLERGDVIDEAAMDAELDRWIREDLAADRTAPASY